MNKVILSGNLCRDVETRSTSTGKTVTSNCIAVRRDFKDTATGEYLSDFVNFTAWSQQAEYLAQYAHKGDRVELVGRWTNRTYTAKDGTEKKVDEVQVESIAITQSRQDAPKRDKGTIDLSNLPTDDDLPF